MIDEYVLRGNTAIVKCLIPSFVSDYVHVIEWLMDDGESFVPSVTSENESHNSGIEISKIFNFRLSFHSSLLTPITYFHSI